MPHERSEHSVSVTTGIAVSIDGALVEPGHALVSVFDPGFLHGDGLFEVFRSWRGATPTLDDHLARLLASARALVLEVAPPDALRTAVRATIAAAGGADHRVRVIATRGGRAIVIAEPVPEQPRELAAAVVDWPLPRRTGASHKLLAFADNLRARKLARETGADEAIRLHADATVAEGATSNVFLVRNGEVRTPPAIGILPGVTRARVIAQCAQLGIAVREVAITVGDLHAADELFATSAVRGVVPITRIDGYARASGEVTARLAGGYLASLDARITPSA
jgi:branched-chain amino acid aminotransferase